MPFVCEGFSYFTFFFFILIISIPPLRHCVALASPSPPYAALPLAPLDASLEAIGLGLASGRDVRMVQAYFSIGREAKALPYAAQIFKSEFSDNYKNTYI